MSLAEQMADDIEIALAESGESVTYVTSAGAELAISAIVEIDPAMIENEDDRLVTRTGRLFVARAAATGVPTWNHADYVTVRSERWEVVTSEEEQLDAYWLRIQRVETVRHAAPGHEAG